jgi:hypothetical protein
MIKKKFFQIFHSEHDTYTSFEWLHELIAAFLEQNPREISFPVQSNDAQLPV